MSAPVYFGFFLVAITLCLSPLAIAEAENNSIPQASPSQDLPLESASEILQHAASAARELSYRGRFTYEFGSALETLELVHWVDGGVEHERIAHLSGKQRAFVRSGLTQTCKMASAFLLSNLDTDGKEEGLAEHYQFFLGGEERIAGRPAYMVKIVPKDNFRYTHVLAFDRASGLPLLKLLSSDQMTLERFQFVALEVGESVNGDDDEAIVHEFQHLNSSDAGCIPSAVSLTVQNMSPWAVSWLPGGFVLSDAKAAGQFESVLTYTDGLSAFTVFVSASPATTDVSAFAPGVARRGATLALTNTAQYQGQIKGVALVGEVPLNTAKRVLASLKPNL